MTGEYQDPLLSSSRSPFSSPARTSSRTSLSYTSNPLLDSPTRTSTTRDSFDSSKRDSFTSGRDSPVASSSSRTAIESPMSKYRNSRLQDLEDDDAGEDDSEYTKTVKKINGLQLAQAPAFDDDDDEDTPARSASPTKRPASPVKRPVSPIKPPLLPTKPLPVRPESPASSVGTSASSSGANPASGVGYKSNLGILGNSGPDQCRRCGTTVYFAEKVVAGGHKCVYAVSSELVHSLISSVHYRWHKRCLRCAKCSKALDSHLLEKDNLPCVSNSLGILLPRLISHFRYCKKCYDEQYGIRSQGFVLVSLLLLYEFAWLTGICSVLGCIEEYWLCLVLLSYERTICLRVPRYTSRKSFTCSFSIL